MVETSSDESENCDLTLGADRRHPGKVAIPYCCPQGTFSRWQQSVPTEERVENEVESLAAEVSFKLHLFHVKGEKSCE